MLLVQPPTREKLADIILALRSGELSRQAVLTWHAAVFAEVGWELPLSEAEGYWYFYSLGFLNHELTDGHFLRDRDFIEAAKDLKQVPGGQIAAETQHLRSWQLDRSELTWPLTTFPDHTDLMSRLPGVRGSFERRGDLVEHCHVDFKGGQYLLVKQFDDRAHQVMLLGSNRNPRQSTDLLHVLGVNA